MGLKSWAQPSSLGPFIWNPPPAAHAERTLTRRKLGPCTSLGVPGYSLTKPNSPLRYMAFDAMIKCAQCVFRKP